MAKHLIIFIGIQGAGKTSFYHKSFSNQYIHINLDTLHTRNKEWQLFESSIAVGKDIVIDNTNTLRSERQRYMIYAKEKGYIVIGYFFRSVIKECIERNALRQGKKRVPNQAIACTSNKLQLPSYEEGYDALYYVQLQDNEFSIEKWEENI